jgi:hypothetical protein
MRTFIGSARASQVMLVNQRFHDVLSSGLARLRCAGHGADPAGESTPVRQHERLPMPSGQT